MPLEDPKSQPVAMPQWGAFKLAMLQNQAYGRVSAATSQQRAVSRIETYFSTEVENWPVASMFWQQMVTACPLAPIPVNESLMQPRARESPKISQHLLSECDAGMSCA